MHGEIKRQSSRTFFSLRVLFPELLDFVELMCFQGTAKLILCTLINRFIKRRATNKLSLHVSEERQPCRANSSTQPTVCKAHQQHP
jgi:hypothetical protein